MKKTLVLLGLILMKKEFHRIYLHFTENVIFLLNESDIVWLKVGNNESSSV